MAEENKEQVTPFVHPHDMEPTTDLSVPLTESLFLKPPVDVLNTKLHEMIGNKFLSKKGTTERERETSTQHEEVTAEFYEGTKYIGLLFSADWCAPCHTMLPLLRNFYTDINLDERQLEVILVSSDHNEKDFGKHFGGMPWTALPYGDRRNKEWAKRYNVQGVPKLVILETKTGFKVTETARKDLALASQEEPGVKGVWKSWAKLLEINKGRGVKAAEQDAVA
jgi:thiol-disulfide isomerase/thioredoxin